jgi:hypothetical protein
MVAPVKRSVTVEESGVAFSLGSPKRIGRFTLVAEKAHFLVVA